VRLHRLSLRNFRQHVETDLVFTSGLTGIIGENGAGKTTILEAIAWALYGNSAARGTRDSLRHARAPEGAGVRVGLEFSLGSHRYRVERSLRTAEVYQDALPEPVASGIKASNDLLQRRLGMSRAEFFNTYFTGQKELDVMAALGPTDRARFLARVLGYDRLSAAQELLREQRRTIVAELTGLRRGMPDAEVVAARAHEAEAAERAAREACRQAEHRWHDAERARALVAPEWEALEMARARWQELETERRLVEQALAAADEERATLMRERDALAASPDALAPLRDEVAALPARRGELEAIEALSAADAERRAVSERVEALREEQRRLDERWERLASAPALEEEQRGTLEALRRALEASQQALDEARTTWTRDRQEAETRREALRTQHEELAAQRTRLEELGVDGPCPTCGRPLGVQHAEVLALLTEQVETVCADGLYYRQRVKQLAVPPEAMTALEARRSEQQQEVAAAERRYARIVAAVQEREQLRPQRETLAERLQVAERRRAELPTGYDAAAHRRVRAEVTRLSDLATQVATLEAAVARAEAVTRQLAARGADLEVQRARHAEVTATLAALAFEETRHEVVRRAHVAAVDAVHAAEVAVTEARGGVAQAMQQREAAERARADLERLRQRAGVLEAERSLHEDLDETFAELRDELNGRLRPELSELASGFLEALTDGRYAALELDAEYGIQVLEDGVPKSVLSGGEEDLCNLVLRLAISQMIAERAGQAFSLLILDEVFGSLDELRRENVLALLRRLHDRFEQVMVITHIEDVREGLDRVLQVTYDAERGASRVTAALGGAAGAELTAWSDEVAAEQGLADGEAAPAPSAGGAAA
jgi:exonuclease SbcC